MSKKMKKLIACTFVAGSMLVTGSVCHAAPACSGCEKHSENCKVEARYCSNCGLRLGPGHRCGFPLP